MRKQMPKMKGGDVNKSDWHDWFAWHPVFVDNERGGTDFVWFETVQRKLYYGMPDGPWDAPSEYWEYRDLPRG